MAIAPQRRVLLYGRVIFIYATLYSRPSVYAATSIVRELETVLPVYAEVESEDPPPNNKRWYETDGGFIYSTNVQPVLNRPNQSYSVVSPQLGEITIPFADAYAKPDPASGKVYRLYFSSAHWVRASHVNNENTVWYELLDDRGERPYYVLGTAIHLIQPGELTPVSPAIADKRIRIDTTAETITALENGRLVFATRISSGGNFGVGKDFRTPLGEYRIYRKRPSRHMAAGDGAAADDYDLPGVPWVSYFNGGIAIHGTYWHNDFGYPWSHGCINLLSQDAKWFYRWANPPAPAGQKVVEAAVPGTVIEVF